MNENHNCHVDPISKDMTEAELDHITYALLAVSGMHCPNCSIRVRNSLLRLKGVVDVRANHLTDSAAVLYNPNITSVENLIQAVAQAGDGSRHKYLAQPLFENVH